MCTVPVMRRQFLFGVAIFVMGIVLLPSVVEAELPTRPVYTVHAWGSHLQLLDLNDLTQMVGYSLAHNQGVLVQKDGDTYEVVYLGACDPNAISNTGLIAGQGYYVPGDLWGHAFVIVPEDTDGDGAPDLWYRDDDSDGVNDLLHDLGRLFFTPDGQGGLDHPPIFATDVNDSGVVVGYTWYYLGGGRWRDHAFQVVPEDTNGDGAPDTWLRDDNQDGINDLMFDLGPLGGTQDSARAMKVTEAGQVVGWSCERTTSGFASSRAVLWSAPGVIQNLGVLYDYTPDAAHGSFAFSINEQAQVVGTSSHPTSPPTSFWDRAFLWSSGAGIQDLGEPRLPPEWQPIETYGDDINEDGWIVGDFIVHPSPEYALGAYVLVPMDSDDDGQPDTWFYNTDGLSPLEGPNDLMIDLDEMLDGVYVTGARRINESGQILAYGCTPVCRYLLLTRCLLSECPDLTGDGIVDLKDLALLLGAYGESDEGDLDCDGDTDVTDLGILLGHYGQVCD